MRNRADKKLQTDRRTDGQADSYISPNRVLGGIITECFTTQWRLLTPLRKEPFDLDRWHWYHRKGLTTRDIHTKYDSFLTYHSKVVANVKVFCVQIDREGKNYNIPGAPALSILGKKMFRAFFSFSHNVFKSYFNRPSPKNPPVCSSLLGKAWSGQVDHSSLSKCRTVQNGRQTSKNSDILWTLTGSWKLLIMK